MWSNLLPNFSDLFQIIILTGGIYFIFNLFRGTRSAQMLLGFALLILGMMVVTRLSSLEVLSWILDKLTLSLLLGLIVIFQPEIRQALAIIGRRRLRPGRAKASDTIAERLISVVEGLARARYGALIAIEREIKLDSYVQSGTRLNAPFVPRLLASIFFPRAPLHDGGVVIRGDTIVAARCIFPLATGDNSQTYGTRHRAALGLSEESDAAVIVVSEERGTISLAFQGRLLNDLTTARLSRYLAALQPREGLIESWRRAFESIGAERDGKTQAERDIVGIEENPPS